MRHQIISFILDFRLKRSMLGTLKFQILPQISDTWDIEISGLTPNKWYLGHWNFRSYPQISDITTPVSQVKDFLPPGVKSHSAHVQQNTRLFRKSRVPWLSHLHAPSMSHDWLEESEFSAVFSVSSATIHWRSEARGGLILGYNQDLISTIIESWQACQSNLRRWMI